jgi:hypothetical protein
MRRSQWPRGLRRRSKAARLLRSWVRIPTGVWMFVCCACCVLSGRGLCDGLIIRPEESYRLRRVVVCDHKTSRTRRPLPSLGCRARENNNYIYMIYNNWSISVALRSKAWVWGHSLAGLVISNLPGEWKFVSRECCVVLGRGLWVRPITRPEESYRLWFVEWVWLRSPEEEAMPWNRGKQT